jgi:hypothetical protein
MARKHDVMQWGSLRGAKLRSLRKHYACISWSIYFRKYFRVEDFINDNWEFLTNVWEKRTLFGKGNGTVFRYRLYKEKMCARQIFHLVLFAKIFAQNVFFLQYNCKNIYSNIIYCCHKSDKNSKYGCISVMEISRALNELHTRIHLCFNVFYFPFIDCIYYYDFIYLYIYTNINN